MPYQDARRNDNTRNDLMTGLRKAGSVGTFLGRTDYQKGNGILTDDGKSFAKRCVAALLGGTALTSITAAAILIAYNTSQKEEPTLETISPIPSEVESKDAEKGTETKIASLATGRD